MSGLFVSESREILEGISLQLIEKANPNNIKRAIEIPDYEHLSSIIALLHEYTHYHCQLMKMDYNQKRYYEEILSIYVEKRAIELLNEFDYKRNGEQKTINFLIWILNWLVNEEEEDNGEIGKELI